MVRGKHGQSHHGFDHRDGIPLRQLHQLIPGTGQPHAAAGADHRLTGLGDGLGHPLDLQVIAPHGGLIAPDADRLRERHIRNRLLLNVHRDINEHRAGTARGGNVKGLLDDLRQPGGILDQIAVLGEGRHGASDIHLLEDIPPQQV